MRIQRKSLDAIKKIKVKPKVQFAISLGFFLCVIFAKLYLKYLYTKKNHQINTLENELMREIKEYHEMEIQFKRITNPNEIIKIAQKEIPQYTYLDLKKIYEP